MRYGLVAGRIIPIPDRYRVPLDPADTPTLLAALRNLWLTAISAALDTWLAIHPSASDSAILAEAARLQHTSLGLTPAPDPLSIAIEEEFARHKQLYSVEVPDPDELLALAISRVEAKLQASQSLISTKRTTPP